MQLLALTADCRHICGPAKSSHRWTKRVKSKTSWINEPPAEFRWQFTICLVRNFMPTAPAVLVVEDEVASVGYCRFSSGGWFPGAGSRGCRRGLGDTEGLSTDRSGVHRYRDAQQAGWPRTCQAGRGAMAINTHYRYPRQALGGDHRYSGRQGLLFQTLSACEIIMSMREMLAAPRT